MPGIVCLVINVDILRLISWNDVSLTIELFHYRLSYQRNADNDVGTWNATTGKYDGGFMGKLTHNVSC